MKILWLGWQELYTTRRMQEAAATQNVQLDACEILDVSFQTAGRTVGAFSQKRNLAEFYDALVVRIFHPYISEALTLARLFREAGKIVIDESLTDEGYVVSKMHDYLLLARNHIPVPDTWQVYDQVEIEKLARRTGFPCVLKGTHGAHGDHVHLVQNAGQLHRRLRRYPVGELAVQEFLPGSEDYRVLTIGYKALPFLITRRPASGDFRTNLSTGGQFSAQPLRDFKAIQKLAESAAKTLRREFAGVDIRMKGRKPVVLEVNRRPDFEGFERAAKMDVAANFLDYIRRKQKGRGLHEF